MKEKTKIEPYVGMYSKLEIAMLAQAFGKSFATIVRWIENKDDRLTSDKAKKALQK
jgi:hypothetical protein